MKSVSESSPQSCFNSASGNATILVNPLPIATIKGSKDVCRDSISPNISFEGSNSVTPYTFYYNLNNGITNQLITLGTDSVYSFKVLTNKVGSYTYKLLEVKDGNNCSQNQNDFATITVHENPLAIFSVNPEKSTILEPTININDASVSTTQWIWEFGDGSISYSSKPESHIYADTGNYIIKLTALNNLCTNSTYHTVKIELPFVIYIPNSFTPNGDGDNELFMPKGDGILKFEMLIFNRWGNLIFTTTDINKGWDGKVNNGAEVAQIDSYVYLINIKALTNKHDYTYRGVVNLIR